MEGRYVLNPKSSPPLVISLFILEQVREEQQGLASYGDGQLKTSTHLIGTLARLIHIMVLKLYPFSAESLRHAEGAEVGWFHHSQNVNGCDVQELNRFSNEDDANFDPYRLWCCCRGRHGFGVCRKNNSESPTKDRKGAKDGVLVGWERKLEV